jgi:hypothetical protein
MRIVDSVMAFEDHYAFKVVYGSMFLGQSKETILFFLILVDLLGSDVSGGSVC